MPAAARRRCKRIARLRRQQHGKVDPGETGKCLCDREPLGDGEWIHSDAAEREPLGAGDLGRECQHGRTVVHQHLVALVRPVPFEHGELGMMQRAALAVAKRAGELDDARLACRQEFLAGEFRRGSQVEPFAGAGRRHQRGREGMQVGFVSRRGHQRRRLDFDEVSGCEKLPYRRYDPSAAQQEWPAVGMHGPERWLHCVPRS